MLLSLTAFTCEQVALCAALGLALAIIVRGIGPLVRAVIARAPNHGSHGFQTREGEQYVQLDSPPAALAFEVWDSPSPRGTIVVLHGVRDNKESMRGLGAMLAREGFRAVLVDARGQGRSTGKWLSYGVVESLDMGHLLDALTDRHLVVGNVGVLGFSYGAATAIQWASEDARIKAVVAIAPFASLRAVVPGYVPIKLPSSFLNACIDRAAQSAGFDPDEASPLSAIRKMQTRVLLIHGLNDDRIHYWHSELLLAAGAGHTELVKVPREGHMSIRNDATGVIRTRGTRWFADNL